MARDNYKNSDQTQSPSTTLDEDSITNLPDLSAFKDSEKQHILSVLIRNEELRNKHLLRFMNLRKEVVDLEQQPPPTSPSVCARCQRRFGFLFNTGDACPKCGVNVCKQCRLMYNVNDNGWLCQLCCKQMQLMSYSGEWIYAIHSNLRKDSLNSSEVLNETIPLSVSTQNMTVISSSDSDPEIFAAATSKPDRFASKLATPVAKPTKSKPKIKANAMIVQNSIDEKKLTYIRERINERPLNESYTQPLPRRAHRVASPASTQKNSPREVNSTLNNANSRQGRSLNKENSSVTKNVETLKVKEQEADLMSVTSSEWGGDDNNNKLEKEKLKVQQQQTSSPQKKQQNPQLSTGDSRLNVASATTKKSRRERLSASMQSLRNTVTRHPLSSSRTSLSAEKNKKDEILNSSIINDEDTTVSSKIKDEPSKSNSHTNRSISQSSVDDSKQASSNKSRHESINTVVSPTTTESKPFRKQVSIADSVVTTKSDYSEEDNKPSTTGNRSSVAHNEDDIDRTFEKAKLAPSKRATSLRDLRGSQLSLSSFMSEAKARFDLEITGTIELKLSHHKNTGSFDIFIKQCTNLAAAKRGQTSNPYCKIYLLPDKSKDSKRKTGIRKGTTNPIFGETLRYHLSDYEFKTRTLWISVWNDSSLGHNDFLGEIHVPLANCKLDQLETYPLQSRVQPEQKEEASSAVEPTVEDSEISFELSFIENTNNKENKKDLGTIQVNAIQAKGIYQGKNNVELICKGLLMPDKIKRKLPTTSKGPSPKWDIPLRWESVRLKDLENKSMEISIWSQERFRKTMIGYVRLNSARKHLDSREVKFLVATQKEKSYWESFQEYPTRIHRVKLPLRSATNEHK